MALNPFGIDLPTDGDDICMICHDSLQSAQTYTLPECKHQFHTHCIVTWFRHRGCYELSNDGMTKNEVDGKCPHCGNSGINNITTPISSGLDYYRRSGFITQRQLHNFRIKKKEGKKKGAPALVKRHIQKLEDAQKKCALLEKEQNEFKKTLKTQDVNYNEAKKTMTMYRTKLWKLRAQISRIKRDIASYPIVPLIIPKPVDIN